jgi:hypothetical protein
MHRNTHDLLRFAAVIGSRLACNIAHHANHSHRSSLSAAGCLAGWPAPDQVHAVHRDPDRHLIRRQYPGPVDGEPGQDQWRVRLAMARLWRDAVNRRGGTSLSCTLPEIGIRGNTHFPFFDLDNAEVADQMSGFLRDKGLDKVTGRCRAKARFTKSRIVPAKFMNQLHSLMPF